MEIVAATGGIAFILASLIVGGRMIALSLQTRELPEFMMGMGLFLMGGLGYPLMITAQMATGLPDPVRSGLVAGNVICTVVGHSCLAVFTQHVFRRDSRFAQSTVAAMIMALVVGAAHQGMARGFIGVADGATLTTAFIALGIINLFWACAESALYFLQMRRRRRIGLADPLLVERFRLWTIAIGSAAMTATVSLAFQLAGVNIAVSALGASFIAPLGLTTATALWFAFWPPKRYAKRFRTTTDSTD